MTFLDEVHLLLTPVSFEDNVDLLKRNQAILLRSDEDTRTGYIFSCLFKIHLIDVEVGLG